MGILMQIVPLDMTVSDRWFYFPIIGLLGMAGLAVSYLSLQGKMRQMSVTLLVVVIIALCVRTMVRNANWINADTLYEHDVLVDQNADLVSMLGAQLELEGQYSRALVYLKKTAYIYPEEPHLNNLGVVYEEMGDYSMAINYYYLAYRYNKTFKNGNEAATKSLYDNLARVLTYHGNHERAKQFILTDALKKYPQNGNYWAFLALCYYAQNQQKEALTTAKKAKTMLHNLQGK